MKREKLKRAKLKRAAKFLRTKVAERPKKFFHMDNWASGLFKSPEMDCETVACALAHLTILFPEELRIEKSTSNRFIVRSKQGEGYWAAVEVFGLTLGQSMYLFDPYWYKCSDQEEITPYQVADHIDEVLAGRLMRIGV